ncbi:ran exchange factor Prp20/Pim1 [Pyronema domesticum]|uniref:Similar to Protein pim1 acc. no. P28745 n=1 Tax=Pyronema omphalodes (strain CBS 100304) TaxID=1076935 RepID=U4LU84_PYROM|nr:ran exchange factor Prp20/Pim1 [Pyronema domesticum]CCX33475.1 Similar to Protein pim1; acc. no. P28745 [Pyronema omphalodes CBS 100304]
MPPKRVTKRKADALEESTTATNQVVADAPIETEKPTPKKAATSKKAAAPKKAPTAPTRVSSRAPPKKLTPETSEPPAKKQRSSPKDKAALKEKPAPKEKPAVKEKPAPKAKPAPKEKAAPKAKAATAKATKAAKPAAKVAGKPIDAKKVEKKKAAPKVKAVPKPKAAPKEKPVPKPKAAPKEKPAPKPKAPPKEKPAPKPLAKLTSPPTEKLSVFAFGTGELGELGLGPQPNAKIVKRPRLNAFLDRESVGISAIAYGGMHGACLTHDGKVYTWGVNDLGALGRITSADGDKLKDANEDSDSEDEENNPLNEDESTPKLVTFPEGTIITRIAAGDSITFAVTDTGLVYGWGTFRSNEGVLGFSSTTRIQQTPVLIKELKNIISIVCGNDHAIALDNKGKAWAWGSGQQSQLGRRVVERTRLQGTIPREIGIPRKKVASIHSGSYHSFAITTDGLVYAWGLNTFAQCGIYQEQDQKDEGSSTIVQVPTRVKSLEKWKIVDLDGGDRHSIALSSEGDLLAWGRMDAHQVGISHEKVPQEDVILDVSGKPRCLIVPHVIMPQKFVAIASGSNHNIAIEKEEGAAYSWGFGDMHQCGLGAGNDVPEPTKIENTAVKDITLKMAACGGQQSILAGVPKETTTA